MAGGGAASGSRNDGFFKLFEASPDAVALARSDDDVVVAVNAGFSEMLGWKSAEAVGKTARDLSLWPSDVERDAASRGGLRYIEHRVMRKDGRLADVLLSIKPVELDAEKLCLFTLRDITEQMDARRALEASEARLKALVHATFEGIAISEGGKVVDANEQLTTMFRMAPGEMDGRDVWDLVAPESRQMVAERMRAGDEGPYEHLSMRLDGTVFPVEVRARAVDVGGRKLRMTAIRDVTERRRAEAERERLIAELSARNAEMEQFTYTVSHDLKSPLVTISGFLGMLERDIASGERERIEKDIARIASAANKMMRLLTDLLELSRVGRVARVQADAPLADIVREALELVSGVLAERGVRVDVAPALPTVFGDRGRLVQVFQNLLENAAKYMGDRVDPVVRIGARPALGEAVVYVADNGIGIEPRHQERIFGLFEKLDPKSEGTGVGLALVRRILEFHGGTVSVESSGEGSTFVLRLPEAKTIRE